jgi:hypothetical protein
MLCSTAHPPPTPLTGSGASAGARDVVKGLNLSSATGAARSCLPNCDDSSDSAMLATRAAEEALALPEHQAGQYASSS